MSCCAPGAEAVTGAASREEIGLASRDVGGGLKQTDLAVPGVHCGACIRTVETALARLPGVEAARVNLSSRRVTVKWRGDGPPDMVGELAAHGYRAHLFEAGDAADSEYAYLVRALAVAGFCAMNIMMLSVSVWSGADAETRQGFHWISAALALPTLVYSGGVFYASAWGALKHGRTNMDVPISIGITLAFLLSLYDTLNGGHHAYFDAATSLIFFLLIGRTLDHLMREKARGAVRSLVQLAPRGALVERVDGSRDFLPIGEIEPGLTILVQAGERIPVDGKILDGAGYIDRAIATGESAPVAVSIGSVVQAGALNLSGPVKLVATARVENSFLAEMVRLMEAAEGGRSHYRRIADRAAQLYSPVVHLAAFLTFLGWIMATGDWHRAISIAIAVLIITCPCALGLAVPIVQVVAARRLFEAGVMMKDGSAIERLAEIDTVVFDKTGTLTTGRPKLDLSGVDPAMLARAAQLARGSIHPVSVSIAQAANDLSPGAQNTPQRLADVTEFPGLGVEARSDAGVFRLGRAAWALGESNGQDGTVLARDGVALANFRFSETLRPDARRCVDALRTEGLAVELLSGDRKAAVASIAGRLGVSDWRSDLLPGEKVAALEGLKNAGHRALMVGDGLNDAPALAAAHVSIAPATAADIGRKAADFVFLRESLAAIPYAFDISRKAGVLVRQNFGIAIVYNALAMPVAIAGCVTPLIAALAMSISSIIVVANALRLRGGNATATAKVVTPVLTMAPAE